MRRAALAVAAMAVLLGVAMPAGAAGGARRALDEGLALFAARRYDEAAGKFAEAAAQAGAEGLDPAVAGYDRGIALLRAGKGAEAAAVLAEALRSPDAGLRESALYHRGIALTAAAETAEGGGETGKAVALLEEALDAYEGAMRIDPEDEDPKVNHELVSRRKARLEEKTKGAGGRGRTDDAKQEQKERQSPPEPEGRGQEKRPVPQGPPGKEMRPDEARTLLDAMRQQEQAQRGRTRPSLGGALPVEKNW